VVTLGLAEVWFDKTDGTVFPRGLTIDQYDPDRHGFRISGLEENVANIARIRNIVRKHRGGVPLIFTLSPVPLSAAFRPINWVAANTVSKSVLRLAIDRLCTVFADDPTLFYFPAYEIVTGYFAEPFGEDMRHVRPEVVDFVMKTFERTYLRP
jgi:hypothetical protein